MKKLLAMALALVLGISCLAGCGGKDGGTTTAPAGEATTAAQDTASGETEAGGSAAAPSGTIDLNQFEDDDIGVCLVINTNLGDKSICDLSYAGLQQIGTDYGVRVKCIELGGDATKQVPTFIELAEDPDWDIIIAGTPNLRESLLEAAGDYPEQFFILYDAAVANADEGVSSEDYPNVYSMEHAQNEGSYVVGAAAAMLTTSGDSKTNDEHIIGFVGGGQNTAIEDFLVGYIEGAKAVDPEIKVLVSYIGSFSDSAKGKELAMAQIDQGADVVFAVAGGAGLGVLAGCAEKGVYAIGVDGDQYEILKDDDPTTAAAICTSMQKKCDQTVYSCVSGALEGTLPYGTYDKLGLADGVVGSADNENFRSIFTEEQIAALQEMEAKVASGEVSVFTAIGADDASIQAIKDSVQ
ncbi:MAG: BMP family ABC transporter substrate-binding protein [Lachnospiraceae bacterium]|nr:BMP family ABC transporter substrate-binding protein [Lachnospiraceae bacterium]